MDVYVLNKDFQRTDVIDVYESFIWTDRYCGYGDFELQVPATQDMFNKLQKDLYLQINDSEFLMIIEGLQIETDLEKGNDVIVTGRSLESILDRRIIWKQTSVTGNFQNGIKKLLDENVISPEIPERKIPNFVFKESTDPAITNRKIDVQYTGDNLYDAILKLCQAEHIGFKVTLNSSNQFEFQLYAGKDRSFAQTEREAVEFSPRFDNLLSTNHVETTKSEKNVTLVGGEGEGAERRTVTVGEGSGLGRKEIFTDARDVSSKSVDEDGNEQTLTDEEYASQLSQRGNDTLSENTAVNSFDGEVNANVQFLYGRDYYLGDIVQIRNEYGFEGTTRIIEVVSSDDTQNGLQRYPTFKSDSSDTNQHASTTTSYAGSGSQYSGKTTITNQQMKMANPTSEIVWPDAGHWNDTSFTGYPYDLGGLRWTGTSDGVHVFVRETARDNLNLCIQFTDDNSNGLTILNAAGTVVAQIGADGTAKFKSVTQTG